ncbi:putative receptor-like protein kinase [Senna tora]|uniref:Putative receptor-like protein kinase n=1 Tax=Senna tora TaxID=362788 RepID=A0A834TA02_9FABA|nr:putative receptor-like protein kinase [Senna tora]
MKARCDGSCNIRRGEANEKMAIFTRAEAAVPILIIQLLYCYPLVAGQSKCGLNLSASPYVRYGECGSVKEELREWEGFPNTLCCRNVLTTLSQALALQARGSDEGSVFISQTEWSKCSQQFESEEGVSPNSCGLDSFYSGTTKCSNVRLQDIEGQEAYQDAMDKCAHFDKPFVEACPQCSNAILGVTDTLYQQFVGREFFAVERAVCGVAALVSVSAGKPDDPFISNKVLTCLLPPQNNNDEVHLHGLLKSPTAVLMVEVVIGVMGVAVIIIVVKYCVSKKKGKKRVRSKEITAWSGMYWFSKAEIENAIKEGGVGVGVGGSERKVWLGRGSAGQVYKGVLPSGQVVAIKHLTKANSSDSFTREVEGLSRLRHPNLVCLFGCCMQDGHRYLVYEYCAEGNLAQHLLRRDSHLTWETRVKILRDCSFALKYLHHHIEGCVVHRDIKLTNILLTENLQAKLSDFGLAKMLGMEESKVFTDVRGTIGYMDPEYMSNAKLTCASDIYSFGIVALQILSGQKVIELDLDARDQLTRKARDVSMGRRPISDFEDPRLQGQVNKADFEVILQIAVLCVAKSSKGRPTIEVVFEELDKAYKNTLAEWKPKQDRSTSGTSTSKSSHLLPV